MTRPHPPSIGSGPHPPRCPMCLDCLFVDGFVFVCTSCDAMWAHGTGKPGRWLEPDEAPCGAVMHPYGADTVSPLPGAAIAFGALTWRCGLTAGHTEWHRTTRLPGLAWSDDGHAHTYMPGVTPLDCATGAPCGCETPYPGGGTDPADD